MAPPDTGWPPDTGQGPQRFQRSYLDDIHGVPISEEVAVRDGMGRLVDVNDMDEPDRDDLLEGWTIRGEDDPPDP